MCAIVYAYSYLNSVTHNTKCIKLDQTARHTRNACNTTKSGSPLPQGRFAFACSVCVYTKIHVILYRVAAAKGGSSGRWSVDCGIYTCQRAYIVQYTRFLQLARRPICWNEMQSNWWLRVCSAATFSTRTLIDGVLCVRQKQLNEPVWTVRGWGRGRCSSMICFFFLNCVL